MEAFFDAPHELLDDATIATIVKRIPKCRKLPREEVLLCVAEHFKSHVNDGLKNSVSESTAAYKFKWCTFLSCCTPILLNAITTIPNALRVRRFLNHDKLYRIDYVLEALMSVSQQLANWAEMWYPKMNWQDKIKFVSITHLAGRLGYLEKLGQVIEQRAPLSLESQIIADINNPDYTVEEHSSLICALITTVVQPSNRYMSLCRNAEFSKTLVQRLFEAICHPRTSRYLCEALVKALRIFMKCRFFMKDNLLDQIPLIVDSVIATRCHRFPFRRQLQESVGTFASYMLIDNKQKAAVYHGVLGYAGIVLQKDSPEVLANPFSAAQLSNHRHRKRVTIPFQGKCKTDVDKHDGGYEVVSVKPTEMNISLHWTVLDASAALSFASK